ncbi:hypothetical protein BCS96_09645 [Vibrio breoganii]|uniref:WYL domain-containing protein n=2 Tax=Vibrio breoganii TaxID=553239 RepID=UPI000C8398B6|nr:hypothetical protein [Vibrio breoganii]PMG39309.1 hypothetical protein BCU93_12085 [Vibrio breoganii]PML33756.1 hypothetical protein BCT78_14360 [Vibrio breoganii]PML91552.1 hypothetical protein BCT68_03285 [Vibrio breoganii]PMO99648.1 hypothetical protein BCS96_09645 [Vibrio breoganii]
MWFGITLLVLVTCFSLYLGRKRKLSSLNNREIFDLYVEKHNLSLEEQVDLCQRLNLDHQIGHRAYDSVEDWQRELTIVWSGTSADIEFTYRKYDERERRVISPTEFGFDGNKRAYIKGVCHVIHEQRTFKTARIETKLKVGAKRYDMTEWLTEILQVNSSELQNSLNVKL